MRSRQIQAYLSQEELLREKAVLKPGFPTFFGTATTTGAAQTVTLNEWNCVLPTTIFWGDGASTVHPANQDGVSVAHEYAAAGTYTIKLAVAPSAVREIDFRDAKLTLNSVNFRKCTGVTYLRLNSLAGGVLSSGDLASMPLTYLHLYNLPGMSGVFNSADLAGMPLTYLTLSNLPGHTHTIAAADFEGFTNLGSCYYHNNSLTQAQVDAILAGLYTAFASRTVAGGTLNVGGTNAAPSGTYQAQCPPTTGKERAYELLNDSCEVNPTKKWATVTFTA